MPENGGLTRGAARAAALAVLAALLCCWAALGPAPALASPAASQSVVGGHPTSAAEWPYQVALLRRDSVLGDYQRQFCGGAVLTPTLILTAAHCIAKSDPDLLPAQIDVLIGRTQLSASDGQLFAVSNIHSFGYDQTTEANDVVLLDISPGATAAPRVLLPGPGERTLWDKKGTAFVTGWGATAEGAARSDVLQEAPLRMIADDKCGAPFVYASLFDPATMVCAGYLAGGVDSCQGDSGGPLSVPARHGQWRLAGTVSFGDGCARRDRPGVYARVGADPLRSRLQAFVNSRPGAVNIIGSGGSMPCNPTIAGTEGRDRIQGTKRADVIDGLGGRDVISGRGGDDVLCGDEGSDLLRGGPGADRLRGGSGGDTLLGGPGADTLRGGGGADTEHE